LDDISGDIRVTAIQREITLHLAENVQYRIGAKASVVCDFPGSAKRRFWLIGHRFSGGGSAAAQKLLLRIGSGDILILRARKPSAPPPLGQ
jgi:hypothetical protein